jgi:hypothetical protein
MFNPSVSSKCRSLLVTRPRPSTIAVESDSLDFIKLFLGKVCIHLLRQREDIVRCRLSSYPHLLHPPSFRKSFELVYRQSCLPDDSSQCASGHFFVIGYDDASMRRHRLSENDVAATLPIPFISDFLQGSHHLASGDTRQNAHT